LEEHDIHPINCQQLTIDFAVKFSHLPTGFSRTRGGAMLSLIVLIAAALVTSSSAVTRVPWSATGAVRKKRARELSLLHIAAGALALGSVLLAVHIQQEAFQ
jgi:hypothetical protein